MKTNMLIISLLMLTSINFVCGQTPNFQDNDLEKFINYVAETTGKTILYDATVRGKKIHVSNLKSKTPDEVFKVFQSIMEYQGYILETIGENNWEVTKIKRSIQGPWTQTPVIKNIEQLQQIEKQDAFITMLLPLKYVSAREVQTTLRALRMINPQSGNLAGIEGSNTILITDFAPNVRRIYDVVQQIDRKKAIESEEQTTLQLDGQKIPLKITENMDIYAKFTIYRNVGMTITNNDGQVLSHMDSMGNESKLWLTPHLSSKNTQLNFSLQVLNNDMHKTNKVMLVITVYSLHKVDKKEEYRELWSFSLKRVLPTGKVIKFSLAFE